MDPITGAIIIGCILFGAVSCSDSQETGNYGDGDTDGAGSADGDGYVDIDFNLDGDDDAIDSEIAEEVVPSYECLNGRVNSCYSLVGSEGSPEEGEEPAPGNVVDLDIHAGKLLAITGRNPESLVNSNKLFSMNIASEWESSVVAEAGPSFATEATDGTPIFPEQLVSIEDDAISIPYAMGEYSGVAFLQPSDVDASVMNNSFIPLSIEGDPDAEAPVSGMSFEPSGVQSMIVGDDALLVGGVDLITGRGMVIEYALNSSLGPLNQANVDTAIMTNHGRIVAMRRFDSANPNVVMAISNSDGAVHLDVIDISAQEVTRSMSMSGCRAVDIPEMLPAIYSPKTKQHVAIIPADCGGAGKLIFANISSSSMLSTQDIQEVPRDAILIDEFMVCMIGAADLFCRPTNSTGIQMKSSSDDSGEPEDSWFTTQVIKVGGNLCSMVLDEESGDVFIASGSRLNEPEAGDDSPCQFISRVDISFDYGDAE
jgi:hypothetical protein